MPTVRRVLDRLLPAPIFPYAFTPGVWHTDASNQGSKGRSPWPGVQGAGWPLAAARVGHCISYGRMRAGRRLPPNFNLKCTRVKHKKVVSQSTGPRLIRTMINGALHNPPIAGHSTPMSYAQHSAARGAPAGCVAIPAHGRWPFRYEIAGSIAQVRKGVNRAEGGGKRTPGGVWRYQNVGV